MRITIKVVVVASDVRGKGMKGRTKGKGKEGREGE